MISPWLWMAIALQELGVAEVKGGENPRIMEFHKAAGDGADEDEDAWCAAFMSWVMTQAGYGAKLPKGAGSARSWLTFGKTCTPQVGCIVVFWRDDPKSWKGHVGFLLASRDGVAYVLGGNQGNRVSVSTMPLSQVLGYRLPE